MELNDILRGKDPELQGSEHHPYGIETVHSPERVVECRYLGNFCQGIEPRFDVSEAETKR